MTKPEIIEVPEELLESILLIPTEYGPCLSTPTIKVERQLGQDQIKEVLAYEEARHGAICQMLEINPVNRLEIPTLKETLIRKDISFLVDMIASTYHLKIRKLSYEWSCSHEMRALYQIVETDWTLKDISDDDQTIHYEVFTKREIFIREEL